MFSFATPALLWLLPLLSAPIIFHFMKRSIVVNIHFPTIRFLSLGRVPKEGRRQLRDLLLLLLRLLLFTLIILAVAGPSYKSEKPIAVLISETSQVIFAVDSSASMGINGDQEKLKQALERLFEEDIEATIFTFDQEARMADTLAKSAQQAENTISTLGIRPLTSDSARLSLTLSKLIQDTKAKRVVIFSDFQKSDWTIALLQKLPRGVEVEFINVLKSEIDNVGITKVTVQHGSGKNRTVLVTLHNFTQHDQALEIHYDDGINKLKKAVNIPALKSLNSTFSIVEATEVQGHVYIDHKERDADDSYHFWLGDLPAVELLLVSPITEDKKEELFFITKVLQVQPKGSQRLTNVTSITSDLFPLVDLSSVNGVVISGAGAYFDDESMLVLTKYINEGGVVLVTPSNAAALQFQRLQQAGLLNLKFNGFNRGTRESSFYLNEVVKDSFLEKTFPAPENSDLFQFPIHRYCRVQTFSPVKNILRTTDGDAVLYAQTHGKGSLYALGFALDSQWSEFPLSSSFLPVMHEVFNSSKFANESGVVSLTIDQFYKQFTSNGNPLQATALLLNERPVEVNVDRSESLPDVLNFAELRQALVGNKEIAAKKSSDLEELKYDLRPYFILAMVVFLLLEILISLFADLRQYRQTEEL